MRSIMSKTKTKKATPAPVVPEVKTETTVEWQVTPGDTRTVHIFHTPGAVFGFLASEWQRFALSWTPTRTCSLGLEIRRVEREKHSR